MIAPAFPAPGAGVPGLTDLAHQAVRRAVRAMRRAEGDGLPLLLVDATAGNGHDTLFLAQCAAEGSGGEVIALDVQQAALDQTRARLAEASPAKPSPEGAPLTERTRLLLLGHEHLESCLRRLIAEEAAPARLAAVLFNLGFLPGSDKRVVTRPETTRAALEGATRLLCAGGVVAVHMYSGHPGGREECEAVLDFASALPWKQWRVLSLAQHNKPRNREWLVLAERLADRLAERPAGN